MRAHLLCVVDNPFAQNGHKEQYTTGASNKQSLALWFPSPTPMELCSSLEKGAHQHEREKSKQSGHCSGISRHRSSESDRPLPQCGVRRSCWQQGEQTDGLQAAGAASAAEQRDVDRSPQLQPHTVRNSTLRALLFIPTCEVLRMKPLSQPRLLRLPLALQRRLPSYACIHSPVLSLSHRGHLRKLARALVTCPPSALQSQTLLLCPLLFSNCHGTNYRPSRSSIM
jgi:hypothetical protein